MNVAIPESAVTVFVGPSGSGKTTFLRSLNRLHDFIPVARMTGNIVIDGEDITLFEQNGEQMSRLRQRIGMLFQQMPYRTFGMASRSILQWDLIEQNMITYCLLLL